METQTIRHVPWTCQWGRFGVAVEEVHFSKAQVDEVFWGCHHPVAAPRLRMLQCHECEHCPHWELASRLIRD